MSLNIKSVLSQIIASKAKQISELTTEIKELEKAASFLSETAPRKPGKKAAKKTAVVAKKAAQKPGKKAAKKPAAAPVTKKPGKKAAKKVAPSTDARSTVTRGGPSMVDKVVQAMGDKNMTSTQVVEAMKAKGTMPDSSNEKGYVASVLHTGETKGIFEKVSRGVYRVSSSYKPQEKKAKGKASNGDGQLSGDKVAAEMSDLNLGGDFQVAENPFSE